MASLLSEAIPGRNENLFFLEVTLMSLLQLKDIDYAAAESCKKRSAERVFSCVVPKKKSSLLDVVALGRRIIGGIVETLEAPRQDGHGVLRNTARGDYRTYIRYMLHTIQ